MESKVIYYQCPGCDSHEAVVTQSGPHIKLSCFGTCGRFIKFISKSDLDTYTEVEAKKDGIDQINFKLDLIIDHLGIKGEKA